MIDRAASETEWGRRRWLIGATLAALGAIGADATPARPTADAVALDAIRGRLRDAKLADIGTNETAHYLAIGDAPDDFRAEALGVCEGLATTFQKHLLTKGIEIALPAKKMTVVVLAGRDSYESYKGEKAGGTEGGLYDLDANLLVIFHTDNPQVNTFTLVHEATHQLTYNTGLLSRQGDVPVAVSEGFGAYGEVYRKNRPSLSKPNALRLGVLKNSEGGAPKWIPVAKLLTNDELFSDDVSDEATVQLAYAESWLLIYDLLQTNADARKLQTYLAALRTRRDPGQRLADAEKAFGDLDRLDAGLKRAARKLR